MAARPSEPDDDLLMSRTATGEEEAFRLLVRRWEADVFAFLLHMLGSREDAEDLAQETFVKVYRQASRYRPQGRFRSWLLRIAGNLARSRLRRRRIIRWLPFEIAEHDAAQAGPDPDAELVGRETALAVRRAMAQLAPRQRQALALHRFQGLSYRETALAMGTTVAGVESLIQRALAAMRARLDEEAER